MNSLIKAVAIALVLSAPVASFALKGATFAYSLFARVRRSI